jgi:glucan-binding YG repeat protein
MQYKIRKTLSFLLVLVLCLSFTASAVMANEVNDEQKACVTEEEKTEDLLKTRGGAEGKSAVDETSAQTESTVSEENSAENGILAASVEENEVVMEEKTESGDALRLLDAKAWPGDSYASYTGMLKNPNDGLTYYIVKGKISSTTSGLVHVNGSWYYLNKGLLSESYTGLVYHYGGWYYVEKGALNWNYTGLVYHSGSWYHVQKGVLNWNYTGLSYYNGFWFYVKNGVINWNYTGLSYYNGSWFYVQNGKLNWNYSNLVKYNGTWFYVHNGKIDWNYSTLAQVNGKGTWYYVKNGKIDWTYSGLSKYNGKWYYIKNGILTWNYTGLVNHYGGWYYVHNGVWNQTYNNLVKYNGGWYYVKDGKIDWSYTSLARVNNTGSWYYVLNGKVDWNFSGLVKYYSTYYYIQKGTLNWNYTGLVYYYGKWYYVEKGALNWNYTGLCLYNGKLFYVKKGVVDWNYSGSVTYNGHTYTVDGGVANTVLIAHAAKDENGRYRDGQAGDQTGEEVYIRTWYDRPWNCVLRCTDSTVAERFAYAMERAARNNHIGYDMNDRNTLYKAASKVGWDPGLVTTDVECDCSSLVSVCLIYAGISSDLMYQNGNCLTTGTLRAALLSTGKFEVYTSSDYTDTFTNLKRGDILLYEWHHTAGVLGYAAN